MKFQGDILNFGDFIQVFVFTTNHHLNTAMCNTTESIYALAGKLQNLMLSDISMKMLCIEQSGKRNF